MPHEGVHRIQRGKDTETEGFLTPENFLLLSAEQGTR
jgi:hypothetical protein